jgi:hypothetical protein
VISHWLSPSRKRDETRSASVAELYPRCLVEIFILATLGGCALLRPEVFPDVRECH